MSHEVEKMAYVGEVPWHGLGAELDHDADLDTWKEQAGLDWSALFAPVEFKGLDGERHEFDGRYVLYRSDNGAPLSTASSRYNAVQPPQVLEFFRDLMDQLGFRMETAGCLRGGRKIWALARHPDSLIGLAGGDSVLRHLLVATSFDRSMKTVVQQTATRVVCANTLAMAYGRGEHGGEHRLVISHLTKFDAEKIHGQIALDSNFREFSKFVKLLSRKKTSDNAVREYFAHVFFPPEQQEKAWYSEKGAERRIGRLMDVLADNPGSDLKSARGTWWGALNAVTYYIDHTYPAKNNDVRLDRSWFGDRAGVKQRALDLAVAAAS